MAQPPHIKGGVTAAKGFSASGIHAGIKKHPFLDLALLVSERTGPIAGLFTTNQVTSAPVTLNRLNLKKKLGRAIIINSGNANAFTGPQGLLDAKEMAQLVATQLHIPRHTVFVGSTGVIGPPLPMAAIRKGVPLLLERTKPSRHREAAQAIMTTDTTSKEVALQRRIGGKMVTVGGMAKGAGMIHPDMATMLAFLTTDAAIHQPTLQRALRQAVDASFNCISVDGDASTNDSVLCLANGLAENELLTSNSSEFGRFQHLLNDVCLSLALQICRDGEGATKLVEFQVKGTRSHRDAKRIANTLATSLLVKTALFGEDPNWGRIVAAIGRSGPAIQTTALHLTFDGIHMVRNGRALDATHEHKIQRIMKKKAFTISATVGKGPGFSRIWTTDLSYDYVKINASYRS